MAAFASPDSDNRAAGFESGHWLCVPVPLPEGPAGKSEEAVSEYDPWMFRSGAPGRAGKGSARPGAFSEKENRG